MPSPASEARPRDAADVHNGGPLPPKRAEHTVPFVSTLTFARCDPVPLNYSQYVLQRSRKWRFELWDRDAQTAWELRDGPSGPHELPIYALHGLMVHLGAVRGLAPFCGGSRGLSLLDDNGERLRVLHPDQSVFLTPPALQDDQGDIPLEESGYPDIVLEVDHTTDTRKGKLALYEAMGVPELWIDVPKIWVDAAFPNPPSRPAGLVTGLTILLLEGGRYREYPASRALQGWRATEIHEALNDHPTPSDRHYAVIEKLGRQFGKRTGTGPDDHPLLRSLRRESREEGFAQGRTEGVAEGEANIVRGIVEARGIAVSATFPLDVPGFAEASTEERAAAAAACRSEQDFHGLILRKR